MSFEREFEGDIWVQATFSIRNGRDRPDRINLAAPDSVYDPMPVNDPGPDGMVGTGDDGGQITVYNLRPEFVGRDEQQIATIPGFESSYRGVELTTQKRFSNNWQALMSYTWNDTED